MKFENNVPDGKVDFQKNFVKIKEHFFSDQIFDVFYFLKILRLKIKTF